MSGSGLGAGEGPAPAPGDCSVGQVPGRGFRPRVSQVTAPQVPHRYTPTRAGVPDIAGGGTDDESREVL